MNDESTNNTIIESILLHRDVNKAKALLAGSRQAPEAVSFDGINFLMACLIASVPCEKRVSLFFAVAGMVEG